jgi:hypothetical protein
MFNKVDALRPPPGINFVEHPGGAEDKVLAVRWKKNKKR